MQNDKLKAKFIGLFQNFHLLNKEIYKLELPVKWKIYDDFYVSLLKQNITKKKQVNELLDIELELDIEKNK